MAFKYDGSNLPRFNNYAEALKFWETAKQWRNQDTNVRKLDGDKKHVTIRKLNDDSIACRLHHTDVVTIHPNNIATVHPYGSISTDEFFDRLMPRTVWAHFRSGLVQRDGRYYSAFKAFDLRMDDLSFVTEPEPLKIISINRKQAAEVRKEYNYQEFATWVKMMAQTLDGPTGVSGQYLFGAVREALPHRDQWLSLLLYTGNWSGAKVDVPATLKRVREAIYENHPEVYDATIKPYLTSYAEIRAWQKS